MSFYVLNATADDWESFGQIMPQAAAFAGVTDRSQVAQQITAVLADGLLQEMKGASVTPESLRQAPDEYWFAMTPAGRTLWKNEAQKYGDPKS